MIDFIEYAKNVEGGDLIKLSAQRFLCDLQREDLEFRVDEVERCFRFISTLRHYTGKHKGQRFQL